MDDPAAHADTTSSIYMLVNPANGKPFYVGVAPTVPGHAIEAAATPDSAERAEILRAIGATGRQPLTVCLQDGIAQSRASGARIYWIETLLRSGTGLVNCEASAQTRQRTADIHLAACQRAFRAHGRPPGSAEHEHGPGAPARPAVATAADGARPARHGKAWDDGEVRQLVHGYLSGDRIDDLALALQRTRGSLVGRLRRVAESNAAVLERLLADGLTGVDGQLA